MIDLLRILSLSLFLAFVAAGAVWYGWGLAAQLRYSRKEKRSEQAESAEAEESTESS